MAFFSRAHICQCLTRLSTARGKSVVTVSCNRVKTGEQFVGQVLSLASGLLELGLRPGDVVAICAFNSDLYLEWLLAVAFVGGIVAPLNFRWSYKEAEWALLSVCPVMLVTDKSCNSWNSELDRSTINCVRWRVSLGSSSSFHPQLDKGLQMEAVKGNITRTQKLSYSWAPDAAVIICFTSGTTGNPKGVLINHSALIIQSLAKVAIVGYDENDIYLHTTPLCHIGGLSSALAMLMVGGCHIMIPKFDANLAANTIKSNSVTSLITVPAIMADLIFTTRKNDDTSKYQTVTKILNGGGSLSNQLLMSAKKCFPRARILSAYGMTEACSSLTFMSLHDPISENYGQIGRSISIHQPEGVCVGKPAPHVDLKIHFDESQTHGKIMVRGPHLMVRYWEQNGHSSPSREEEGDEAWLDTGDVGSIDMDGNLWLIGRANGRIKSGGENVYPEEVEAILLEHPSIAAAVAIGIHDTRLTEMVVACIKLRSNWQWSDSQTASVLEDEGVVCKENLRSYCKEKNLTRFKVPKMFFLWSPPFPLTTTGKVRRDQLRLEVMSRLQILHSCM